MELVKTNFTICCYCLQVVLFVSKLTIPLRFEVLLTTEIPIIFRRIIPAIETTNKGPLNLIMKVELMAT